MVYPILFSIAAGHGLREATLGRTREKDRSVAFSRRKVASYIGILHYYFVIGCSIRVTYCVVLLFDAVVASLLLSL